MKPEIQLTVFDTEQLEDITDTVDWFELTESGYEMYAWITINGEKIGLCPARETPKNKVYHISMTDSKDNRVNRKMEVADEIQWQIPVLLDYVLKN